MYNMDPDRAKRRQSLKIIISETIMVISVIFTVVVLAFLVSGYWINSDFKVERQGLLQISSIPTGADVDIDGDSSWLQRTNTSKVLSAGEHTITLTKDGYDSWFRTINISEGLLYRLHYPRLFLQDSTPEEVLDTSNYSFRSFSPDGSRLLLVNDLISWQLVELGDHVVKTTPIDVSALFYSFTARVPEAITSGDILSLDWDQDNSRVLVSMQLGNITEWVLIDIRDADKSINLTEAFERDFSQVQILDHSANNLLAIANGNLYKIDVSGHSLSSALVQGVVNYSHYDTNEVVFSAVDTEGVSTPSYYIGTIKLSGSDTTKLLDVSTPAQAIVTRFYDDKYLTILQDDTVSLYTYDTLNKKSDYDLGFTPATIEAGHDGEFVTMRAGSQIATLDMEAESVTEWSVDSAQFGWIGSDMIYAIDDHGELIVYDFDGLNRRIIAYGVTPGSPATITADKWLYYFDNGHLMRKATAN